MSNPPFWVIVLGHRTPGQPSARLVMTGHPREQQPNRATRVSRVSRLPGHAPEGRQHGRTCESESGSPSLRTILSFLLLLFFTFLDSTTIRGAIFWVSNIRLDILPPLESVWSVRPSSFIHAPPREERAGGARAGVAHPPFPLFPLLPPIFHPLWYDSNISHPHLPKI